MSSLPVFQVGDYVQVEPPQRNDGPNDKEEGKAQDGSTAAIESVDAKRKTRSVKYTRTATDDGGGGGGGGDGGGVSEEKTVLSTRLEHCSGAFSTTTTTTRRQSPSDSPAPSSPLLSQNLTLTQSENLSGEAKTTATKKEASRETITNTTTDGGGGEDASAVKQRSTTEAVKPVREVLKECSNWKFSRAKNAEHPLIDYLGRNRWRERGWLRVSEARHLGLVPPRPGEKLSDKENMILLTLSQTLHGVKTSTGRYRQPLSDLAHAFGRTPERISRIRNNVLDRDFDMKRKARSDAGKTVFNSETTRRRTFTPYNYFKKARTVEARAPSERPDDRSLKVEWERMSDAEREPFVVGSKSELERAVHLQEEIDQILQSCSRRVTWRELASKLNGGGGGGDGGGIASSVPIVSHETLRAHMMSLPGLSCTINRTFPEIDAACMQRRFNWAKAFWLFWNAAKSFGGGGGGGGGVITVLVHLEAKWLYAVVTRKNNRWIPMLGVEPAYRTQQHRGQIDKVTGICTVGFVPFENDITNGGVAIKIDMTRAGRMEEAKQNIYRRVYRDDGSYHTPAIPDNQLQRRGELYFRNMEVTGCSEGTDIDPKFSLLKHFDLTLLPKFDMEARRLSESNNNARVILRMQLDSTDPYNDPTFCSWLNERFDERGWIVAEQPDNSPLTNVMDACIFPSLLKHVTADQEFRKGSFTLEGEELWATVMSAYEKLPLDTIARSFAAHHQIVNAIAEYGGGNGFVREQNSLSIGARKDYLPFFNERSNSPTGVIPIISLEGVAHEVIEQRGLRYEIPDVSNEDVASLLSRQELRVIGEHLTADSHLYEQYFRALLDANIDRFGDGVTSDAENDYSI